jgi:tripartite-type tricarboxylate transporter receptor subunit TctC
VQPLIFREDRKTKHWRYNYLPEWQHNCLGIIGDEMKLKKIFTCIGLALASVAATTSATAETYPSKVVKIIVPYGLGGGSDVLARQIGAKLQEMWGQGVVVDNRTGASGNIGTEIVVRAPADGYTLLLQNSTMVVNPAIQGKLNYDTEKDLTPIMMLGLTPMALVAHPSTNIKNMAGLIAHSKAKPDSLNYASCGTGTPQHFVMEVVKQKAGVAATHVAYKGCAPGLTDVLGGQVQLALLSANLVAPYVKSGRLNAIAVSTAGRYSMMPATPSFQEQGIKPLDFSIWYALMGPPKLPAEVVKRVYTDVQRILADPEVAVKLSGAGVEPYKGNASDLAKLIKTDQVRYIGLAKSFNIKGE